MNADTLRQKQPVFHNYTDLIRNQWGQPQIRIHPLIEALV
jgi:hypothetical protein